VSFEREDRKVISFASKKLSCRLRYVRLTQKAILQHPISEIVQLIRLRFVRLDRELRKKKVDIFS
jgi:hypothetical protein